MPVSIPETVLACSGEVARKAVAAQISKLFNIIHPCTFVEFLLCDLFKFKISNVQILPGISTRALVT